VKFYVSKELSGSTNIELGFVNLNVGEEQTVQIDLSDVLENGDFLSSVDSVEAFDFVAQSTDVSSSAFYNSTFILPTFNVDSLVGNEITGTANSGRYLEPGKKILNFSQNKWALVTYIDPYGEANKFTVNDATDWVGGDILKPHLFEVFIKGIAAKYFVKCAVTINTNKVYVFSFEVNNHTI